MPILKNTVSSRSGRLSSDRVFEEEKKNGKRIGPGLLTGPIVHRPRGWPTCARDGNRVVIGFIAIIVALVQIRGNVISPGPPGQTITFSPRPPPPLRREARGGFARELGIFLGDRGGHS